MTTRNSVTGDEIASKPNSDKYRANYDKIFGNLSNLDVINPEAVIKKKQKPYAK